MKVSPLHDVNDPPAMSGTSAPQVLNMAAVVMLALYFGRELLVPIVLAILLAFVLAPLVNRLCKLGLPNPLSVVLAVALAFGVIGGIGTLVVTQATGITARLPTYQATIQDKVRSFSVGSAAVERVVAAARRVLTGAPAEEVQPVPVPQVQTGGDASTMVVVRTVLAPLLGPVATLGIVVVFVIFILLYRTDLRDRMVQLVGRRDLHRTISTMNDAASRLSRFYLMQLALNAGFGVYVALALWSAGVPGAVLWGIVAGVMRFVPFIGGVLALAPPVLLALAVTPGWSLALLVLALILVGEITMGQVVEPLTFGHSTGLSPVAVILSTAFWAFLWGPVGLLLATPLTVCLVSIGRHVPGLSLIHVLFSNAPPLSPPETFYQRALESDGTDLLRQARMEAERTSRTEYFDQVALPGMAFVQADLARDALDFDRFEVIHTLFTAMLAKFAALPSPDAKRAAPPGWDADGAVLCIPGRGQLDDLAAAMAVRSLRDHGFGAGLLPNGTLGGDVADAQRVRMCCLSVLDQGSSAASVRFFLARIRRRIPDATVVVGLWHASATSPVLAELRSEGADEYIVLSLGEMVALALTLPRRDRVVAIRS